MRVLHTADWHLGAGLEGASRTPDHEHFLAFLRGAVEEHRVEVLVIAGDVFDHGQPSAEALRTYYRFLVGLRGTPCRKVVVVAGNHDSAARLEAPAEVLDAVGVHVVGGLDRGAHERLVVPLEDADGAVRAVLLAVPFVHEYRLGLRTTGLQASHIRAAFKERFRALYRNLTDAALERFPGVPVLATGHLTCVGADRADAPLDIHLVGTIGGLPDDIFDPRLRYVALGHIHRCMRVGGPAWYSGSPIPLTIREMDEPRRVLIVDTDDPAPVWTPTPVDVPLARKLLRMEGSLDDVRAELAGLAWTDPLPPLLYLHLHVAEFQPQAPAELFKLLAETFPDDDPAARPKLVRIRQFLPAGAEAEAERSPELPSLRDVTPEDVFRRLCEASGVELDGELLTAFRSLVADEAGANGGPA